MLGTEKTLWLCTAIYFSSLASFQWCHRLIQLPVIQVPPLQTHEVSRVSGIRELVDAESTFIQHCVHWGHYYYYKIICNYLIQNSHTGFGWLNSVRWCIDVWLLVLGLFYNRVKLNLMMGICHFKLMRSLVFFKTLLIQELILLLVSCLITSKATSCRVNAKEGIFNGFNCKKNFCYVNTLKHIFVLRRKTVKNVVQY